ncbi:glycosyl hydrolase family 28-related protein [Streptomyces sp. WI04-05B]|uniref:glycosyl hydrolase family 28-related protein n=1 Tax=Streptomyces TaxID=1883 RepID=UPI0029ABD32A|nr:MULTISPECIES: glycosyl hydrolase family 28-related protein [unclassified Streptomyces]MDX2548608.1 glycosyl hydrolase family 28-related protein [Streptomyces sp. WI04-05B]MDX2589069.1 glycosyl hydrolase family 28-related protein [Streptomyces sp. WI04-05A]
MRMTQNSTRRAVLGCAVAVAAGAVVAGAGIATAAGPGSVATETPLLWREFTRAPFTHPQIPYVGRAGCFGGAAHRPCRPTVADVRDFGAVADGVTDSAPAINRAIAAAGRAGGGTVTIPPGTFRIDDVIRLDRSNVILKGAGSGRTTLYATRNLTELIGVYGSRYGGDKSGWSWAGGLVWLAPRARWSSLVAAIRAKSWPFEGWTGNLRDEWRPLTKVAPARQGSWTITVTNPTSLRPGALVLLRLADDAGHTLLEHMCGGGPGPEAYFWDDKTKLTSYVPYEWPVRIARVQGRRVTLERPLPLDVRPEWNPQLTTHVAELTGSGVEGLTLEARETPQQPHLLDKGHNGVVLQCAYDCWVDDVTVRHVDNGFGLVSASACTLRRTRVTGRGSHHPYFCREGSHDNLVEDFTIEERTAPAPSNTQLHGINVEGLSSYNVWSRGDMRMGTFDSHRGLPFANVRTDITLDNTGRHGGDASAGPLFGARFTHWNIRVTNARAGLVRIDGLAPYSATVGIDEVREFDQIDVPDLTGDLHTRLELYGSPHAVRPRNLHAAQRAL